MYTILYRKQKNHRFGIEKVLCKYCDLVLSAQFHDQYYLRRLGEKTFEGWLTLPCLKYVQQSSQMTVTRCLTIFPGIIPQRILFQSLHQKIWNQPVYTLLCQETPPKKTPQEIMEQFNEKLLEVMLGNGLVSELAYRFPLLLS